MAIVYAHDKDSITRELLLTMLAYVQQNNEKLEMERKEKGQCICNNYVSYASTIPAGMPVAAMMQFEDCVNCHDTCSVIMSIAINNSENNQVTPEAVNTRIDAEIQQARDGDYVRNIWVDGEGFVKETLDDTIARMEQFRTEVLEAVSNGKAQAMVDEWYAKHYGYKNQ